MHKPSSKDSANPPRVDLTSRVSFQFIFRLVKTIFFLHVNFYCFPFRVKMLFLWLSTKNKQGLLGTGRDFGVKLKFISFLATSDAIKPDRPADRPIRRSHEILHM